MGGSNDWVGTAPLFSVSQQSSGTCYIDGGAAEVWDEAEEEAFPASTTEDAGMQATSKPFEAKLLTAEQRPDGAPLEAVRALLCRLASVWSVCVRACVPPFLCG